MQLTKGGKYVFGWSNISEDGKITLPGEALEEYGVSAGDMVVLSTGSAKSGGFIVIIKKLMEGTVFEKVLTINPKIAEGEIVEYKGRSYCACKLLPGGVIFLKPELLALFEISTGSTLLSIRSSNIAFTMAAKGPLIEKAVQYDLVHSATIPKY